MHGGAASLWAVLAVSRWNASRSRGCRSRLALLTAVTALTLPVSCAAPRPEAPPVTGVARVSGKIVHIHPASSRLELADAGRRFSVFYSDETLIKSGAAELGIADIREGDRIVVTLDDAGEARARLITLTGPLREPSPPPEVAQEKDEP